MCKFITLIILLAGCQTTRVEDNSVPYFESIVCALTSIESDTFDAVTLKCNDWYIFKYIGDVSKCMDTPLTIRIREFLYNDNDPLQRQQITIISKGLHQEQFCAKLYEMVDSELYHSGKR